MNNSGQAVLEDGCIVIRVEKSALPEIVEGSWASGGIDVRLKIVDIDEFTKELINELNNEDETGTTLIHRMFDKAITEASEQGALGIDEHEDQEP